MRYGFSLTQDCECSNLCDAGSVLIECRRIGTHPYTVYPFLDLPKVKRMFLMIETVVKANDSKKKNLDYITHFRPEFYYKTSDQPACLSHGAIRTFRLLTNSTFKTLNIIVHFLFE